MLSGCLESECLDAVVRADGGLSDHQVRFVLRSRVWSGRGSGASESGKDAFERILAPGTEGM